jgi:hypothetical protein
LRARCLLLSCGVLFEEHGSFLLMLVDAIVFMLAVGSFIAASVIYQAIVSTRVYVVYDQTKLPVAVDEFYTLSSCYRTYAKKVHVRRAMLPCVAPASRMSKFAE